MVVDDGGDFFIAMEYVQGTDLKILMQRQRLGVRVAVELIAQIADGLGYAHSKGVVHRDIKPANIIITADKQAKITDFGIARVETSNLTMEGQLLGTPNYMAPEQIQGKEVDHRADIFSLGVMLYETLTGQKPFAADSLTAVTHRIVFEPFTPLDEIVPGLPAGLTQVLDRALAKDPMQRYDRGQEMAEDLRTLFTSQAVAVPPPAHRTGSFLAPDATLVNPAPAASLEATPAFGVSTPAPGPPAAVPPAAPTPTATSPEALSSIDATPAAGIPSVGVSAVGVPQAAVGPATDPALSGTDETAFLSMPPAGRIAVVMAALLVVAVLAVVIGKIMSGGDDPPARESPELERQVEVLPYMERGQELLAAGDPAAALEVLQRAVTLAPADREIRQLRDQAQQELQDLEGSEVAETVGDEGEAETGSSNQTPRRVPVAETSPPPPPAAKATLAVEFFSEVSEGRLTIFNGQQKLFQQAFQFVTGKSGVLRRSRKTSGSLKGNLTVVSGDIDLRIYVKPKDSQTRSVEIKGSLAPGSRRTLRIQVSAEERVTAQLE